MPRPEEILDRLLNQKPGLSYPSSLDRFDPTFREFLLNVRKTLTDALSQANSNVTGGVKLPPFHFDYVDATGLEAFAFQEEDFAFIVIAIPMIELLWQTADRLSQSAAIRQLLDVDPANSEVIEILHITFFSMQLGYLVSHEATHHFHEHFADDQDAALPAQNHVAPTDGSLLEQAQEVHADSFAAYIVLSQLLDGDGRAVATKLFAHRDASPDESLLALFVVGVGALFYALPLKTVDNTTVYKRPHPPAALRVNYVMHSMTSWCHDNRGSLEESITLSRFRKSMRAVAEAIWGVDGIANWDAQTVFLATAAGTEYLNRLERLRLLQFGILKHKSADRKG
jgi:hypothetical protein